MIAHPDADAAAGEERGLEGEREGVFEVWNDGGGEIGLGAGVVVEDEAADRVKMQPQEVEEAEGKG